MSICSPTTVNCLYILDVGHGNCSVVQSGNEVVVIDVGRTSTLLRFLYEQQIQSIRTVYISHADIDHIGALNGLLASEFLTIKNVVLNPDSKKETVSWRGLAYELNEAHKTSRLVSGVGLVSGHCVEFNDVQIKVLGPSPFLALKGVGGKDLWDRTIRSNSMSTVIRVSVSGQHIAILPGDIDEVGFDDLLQNMEDDDLKAPVVVYPHHGGRSGLEDPCRFAHKFLNMVRPSIVVFSIGRGRYQTPNPEVIKVLKQVLPDTRIVCTQLSKHCSSQRIVGSHPHLGNVFARGKINQSCCGGTVVVPLDDLVSIEPNHSEHLDFIRSSLETPICIS